MDRLYLIIIVIIYIIFHKVIVKWNICTFNFNMLYNTLICYIIIFSLVIPAVKCDALSAVKGIVFHELPKCDKKERCFVFMWEARRECGVIKGSDQGDYYLRDDNCHCCYKDTKRHKKLGLF